MVYTVRTLPRAELDAQRIYDWIRERSPDGARRWWLAFDGACSTLKHQPMSHALAPEAEWSDGDIRQLLFKTPRGNYYRLLYVVVEDEVRILRVRGPGEPELLADELP